MARVLLRTVVLLLSAQGAGAIQISNPQFYQMDFYGQNAPRVANTDWGDFQATFSPDGNTDDVYFQLVIRACGGASEFWVIRNMGVPSSGDLDGPLALNRFFPLSDLGVAHTNSPISCLEYAIVLTTSVISTQPTPPAFTTFTPILDGLYDTEGGGTEDTGGHPTDPGPPPDPAFPALAQSEQIAAVGGRNKRIRRNVPDIEEGNQECGPVSVTRSLRWLADNGWIDLGATTNAQLVANFKAASNWAVATGGDPTFRDFIQGKLTVTKDLKVVNKFMVRRTATSSVPPGNLTTGDGTALDRGNHPTFTFIKSEIVANEDMEIRVGWLDAAGARTGGHTLTIIGYDEDPASNKQEIVVQDDNDQSDAVNEPANPKNQRRNTRYTDGAPPRLQDLPRNRVELAVSESPQTNVAVSATTGEATWGGDASDKNPIQDVIPPNGGKLEFLWTIGEFVPGRPPNQHPQHEKYEETNNTAQPKTRRFRRPNDNTIKDWVQTVTDSKGKSKVYGGNIRPGSPWQFHPLEDLPVVSWRIPDLAPTTGNPEFTIYTAVNLDLYIRSNPKGFANGAWSPGQTLNELGVNISNGQISGVQGIYWATTDFTFDPDSATGWVPIGGPSAWLNSVTFQAQFGNIEILAAHEVETVPVPVLSPSGLAVLALLLLVCGAIYLRYLRPTLN